MALYNLVGVSTSTTGTGAVSIGSTLGSDGYVSFVDAGVPDGATVTYLLRDGSQSELGHGTYSLGLATVTRDTVLTSTNGGAKINLSGTANLFLSVSSEDFNAIESSIAALPSTSFATISVAGQSDVVADSPADTLTLVGSDGTSITTGGTLDTITITSISVGKIVAYSIFSAGP